MTSGERIQIECPECDAWTVIAPAPDALNAALNAMDSAYPGVVSRLDLLRVFTASCHVCGVQLTLTITRQSVHRPVAEA